MLNAFIFSLLKQPKRWKQTVRKAAEVLSTYQRQEAPQPWYIRLLATGGALLLLAKTRASWAFAVAIALVVAPHIIGAPAAPDEPSAVPAHLATEFAAVTIGSALVFWLLLGTLFGKFHDVFATRSAAIPQGATA